MAARSSAARRVPGNPLGGMLRDAQRQARSTTRRTGASRRGAQPPEPVQPVQGPRGERGPAGPPGPPGAATVAVTGEDGRAHWQFPQPYEVPPVLTALPVDRAPDDTRTVIAVLEDVTEAHAVVRVWRTRPRRGQGVADPAGPGVSVHLTATAAAG